jgi:hypothetical protein
VPGGAPDLERHIILVLDARRSVNDLVPRSRLGVDVAEVEDDRGVRVRELLEDADGLDRL